MGQMLNFKIFRERSIPLDSTYEVSFENILATPRRWKLGISPLFKKQGSSIPVCVGAQL